MNQVANRRFRRRIVLGWLLAGTTLTLLLPASTDSTLLGWSGVYWLLCAPLLMLLMPAPLNSGHCRDQRVSSPRAAMRRRNSAMMSR